MKHQYIDLKEENNLISLLELGVLAQLCEAEKAGLIEMAFKQEDKNPEQKKSVGGVVMDKPGFVKLQQASIFEGLSEDALQNLLSYSVIRSVDAEQEIVKHGDVVEFLYFIIEGSVKVFRSSQEGKEAPISMLKAGDTFMESAIFMEGVSPASAETLKRSKLLLIPVDIIKQQVSKGGPLCTNVLRIITQRYKSAMQQIESIVTKVPFDRLGYYFLRLRMEQDPDTLNIDLHCQKSMIASYLGMKPETFSRTLKKLQEIGIDVSYKYITLTESNALCRFCDKDIVGSCRRYGTSECSQANAAVKG